MDQLRDNAGTITVADPDRLTRAAWRRAIHAAKQDGLVPTGHHLRHHGRNTGDLHIELIQGNHPDTKYWSPRQQLPVPDNLNQPHPIIAKLQHHPNHICVTTASRDRALRILQTLLIEWERRGHTAELADDGIIMTINGYRYTFHMSEEFKLINHKTTYPLQGAQPTTREVSTGQLVLELPHDWNHNGRRHRWADRTRWTLDDKLLDILTELEARARLDHERHLAALEKETHRRQEWEAAMATARLRFAEDIKIKALNDQVTAWHNATRIRAYCDALQAVIPTDGNVDLEDWIQWARRHADQIDPLGRNRLRPDIPQPYPSNLKPFLDHWSPYGPDNYG
ncbi:hypothetical protein ACFQ1S_00965 [Kibdelosporangium lantanae]|uniref:Uncharacterized protein n=1 Tax=Kibdelosporangium lantanae TaxID=1497396 RepID=A0ABW3M3W3_9PSEU